MATRHSLSLVSVGIPSNIIERCFVVYAIDRNRGAKEVKNEQLTDQVVYKPGCS
jgi:hypothetical protein